MPTLDPAAILRLADRAPGSDDDPLLEGLGLLCSELEATLTSAIGRRVMQAELAHALSSPVEPRPLRASSLIVVVGMPRAGTTAFHHLAAATGAVWTLPYWRGRSPGVTPEAARAEAERYLRTLDRLSPAVRKLHPVTITGPAECATGRKATLRSEQFWYLAPVPAYLEWVESSAPEVWRSWLSLLGALYEGSQPVCLKDPSHLGRWHQLRPPGCQVTIIRFLRDPAAAAVSFARLLAAMRSIAGYRPSSDADLLAEASHWLARRLEQEMDQHGRHPHRLIDVDYTDFAKDPESSTLAILRSCGVAVSEEQEVRCRLDRHRHLRPSNNVQLLDEPPAPKSSRRIFERFEEYRRNAISVIPLDGIA